MDDVVSPACPSCGAPTHEGDRFCEQCGGSLAAASPTPAAEAAAPPAATAGRRTTDLDDDGEPDVAPTCRACGGRVAEDGWCEECGEPGVAERDHWSELVSPRVGGVCDRGRRHARNEDAMALHAADGVAVLVVCDGVSNTPDSDLASLAAARAARDVLATAAPGEGGPVGAHDAGRAARWAGRLVEAAAAADAAIRDAVGDLATRADPPSCTFAAAVVDGPLVVAGWLGDSRVYWLPDEGAPHQVSVDDSAAHELMARGVPRAQAEASPSAHAITRWLGPDAVDTVPSTAPTRAHGPGWVLVCSDGLWNYCSEAAAVGDLVRGAAARAGSSPDAVAGELVRWANAQGGRDNVTVTLARVDAAAAGPFDSLQAEPAGSAAPA